MCALLTAICSNATASGKKQVKEKVNELILPNSVGEMHLGDYYNHYSVHQDYVRDLEVQNAFDN